MKALSYPLLAALLAGAACSNDNGTSKLDAGALISPDGGASPDGGGASPDGGGANPDGAAVTPDGATAQTLVQFVTDLVKNQTSETSTPATIDDKTLLDTMESTAFDSLF
jgi:hypothetical protein